MADAPAAASHNAPEFSVSEVSNALKRVVESNFGHIRLRGEISGYRGPHGSGHCYFSLKDDKAKIDAIIWKGVFGRLRYKPEEGMEVIVTGKISTFPGKSSYQILIDSLEPAGEGALMALLEKRKKQLAAEGLFDESRKKPLPYLPQTIGVITSPTGAVIRDILHRLSDRMPSHVLLAPVRVQGEGAAEEIAAAIGHLSREGRGVKVIIIARGGGSIEDLWPFNEEIVIRAVAACPIPIISAVGHETDTTLIDYASDRRAPTPTAAAEIAVPVRSELLMALNQSGQRMNGATLSRLAHQRQKVEGLGRGLPKPAEILAYANQKLDQTGERLQQSLKLYVTAKTAALDRYARGLQPGLLRQRLAALGEGLSHRGALLSQHYQRHIERYGHQMARLAEKLELLDYRRTLQRGYILAKDKEGKAITSASHATGIARLMFHDGEVDFQPHATPAMAQMPVKTAKSKKNPTKLQANLFESTN